MIRPRVSFLPWFLILAASAAFFLAGCMPKPVLDPGADPARQAFVEFRGHFLAPKPPPAVQAPAEMVVCHHCGLHLPAADAVTGSLGTYCSADHLRRHEP